MKVIINFKTYKEGSGKNALKLIRKLEKSKVKPILCLQPVDIHLSSKTKLEVWAQHVDPINYGSNTGWILPEGVKDNGAEGVLINHSEHPDKRIKDIIKECKELKLKTMVLVSEANEIKKYRKFKPDFFGIEPSEYIGSKTMSVTSKPDLIKRAVRLSGEIPLLVGAGVKDKNDIEISKNLGSKGILISSAVVTSENPRKALDSLF